MVFPLKSAGIQLNVASLALTSKKAPPANTSLPLLSTAPQNAALNGSLTII